MRTQGVESERDAARAGLANCEQGREQLARAAEEREQRTKDAAHTNGELAAELADSKASSAAVNAESKELADRLERLELAHAEKERVLAVTRSERDAALVLNAERYEVRDRP